MIARRSILRGLVALVAAPAIVKVASLMPCAPTEVIRASGLNARNLLTSDDVMRGSMQLFRNSNRFLAMIDEQYVEQFDAAGAKIGSQLRIRLPNDFIASDMPELLGPSEDPGLSGTLLRIRLQNGHVASYNPLSPGVWHTEIPDEWRTESPAIGNLAVAAAAVAVVPKLLDKEVTRRFW